MNCLGRYYRFIYALLTCYSDIVGAFYCMYPIYECSILYGHGYYFEEYRLEKSLNSKHTSSYLHKMLGAGEQSQGT